MKAEPNPIRAALAAAAMPSVARWSSVGPGAAGVRVTVTLTREATPLAAGAVGAETLLRDERTKDPKRMLVVQPPSQAHV